MNTYKFLYCKATNDWSTCQESRSRKISGRVRVQMFAWLIASPFFFVHFFLFLSLFIHIFPSNSTLPPSFPSLCVLSSNLSYIHFILLASNAVILVSNFSTLFFFFFRLTFYWIFFYFFTSFYLYLHVYLFTCLYSRTSRHLSTPSANRGWM